MHANGTDYVLGPNVEKLVMSYNESGGSHGTHGTGNALNNVISGIDVSETLNGLAGNDTIYGSGSSYFNYPDEDIIHGGAGNDLIYGAGGKEPTSTTAPISFTAMPATTGSSASSATT